MGKRKQRFDISHLKFLIGDFSFAMAISSSREDPKLSARHHIENEYVPSLQFVY